MKSILAIALVALMVSAAAADPSKPDWPAQFQGPFGLDYKTLFTDFKNRSSYFYYDWTNGQKTTIDYYNGCLPMWYDHACRFVFNTDGTHLVKYTPGNPNPVSCCKAFSVGSLPPNFLRGFDYNGQENAQDMYGNTHQCNKWKGGPWLSPFYYWTDINSGVDIRFQDGGAPVLNIHWEWGTLEAKQPDPSIFNIPNGCTNSCPILESEAMLRGIPPHVRPAMEKELAARKMSFGQPKH